MSHHLTNHRVPPSRSPLSRIGSGVQQHWKGATLGSTLAFSVLAVGAAAVGLWWWSTSDSGNADTDAILHEVVQGEFLLNVIERGEIQSAGVTEIRSKVETKNTPGVAILRIVPEGTAVKEGDFLVELDASALEAELTTQRIAVNTAQALVIEALNVNETAQIAKREYLEGTFVEERQTIESEVFVAEENLNRAIEYYLFSKKLAAKGYVNELQLQADKFAVEKSTKELEAAQTKLKVLDEFTKARSLKQLESDILISKAKWESERSSYALELSKLEDIEEQIDNCTIHAPKDGVVAYGHVNDRRGEQNFIVEEGAIVRERQVILKLPDPESMRVELTINESLIQYVQPGMPAIISPVGMGDRQLAGEVESVNRYAEPSGWRKANVKEYKAFVRIVESEARLRAGMTSSVTIQCIYVPDAMQVPVQAVYAHGEQFYCFVYQKGRWEAAPIQCGPTNDKFFVVESGLQLSDRVALNPRRYLNRVELPELPPEQEQRAVSQNLRKPIKADESQEEAVAETDTTVDGPQTKAGTTTGG